MGLHTTLTAADGHVLGAYRADPKVPARGGIVLLQEVFGVNAHIRAVADDYAARGYAVVAPALFDRSRRDVELGYEDAKIGIEYMNRQDPAQTLLDIAAALHGVAAAGRTAVIGYCWGGRLAYVGACSLPFSAAVCYYGGRITEELARTPRCPTMFHFGERDANIPLADVERIRAAYPAGVFHLYAAGHGFNCSERASYDAPSAALALERTLVFLSHHVG